MTESIDVNLLSHDELEQREMFKAANKQLKDRLNEINKYIKKLEQAGMSVPQDLLDRRRAEEDRIRNNNARQVAKAATEEATKKIGDKFDNFKSQMSQMSSMLRQPESVGSLARAGARSVANAAIDSITAAMASGNHPTMKRVMGAAFGAADMISTIANNPLVQLATGVEKQLFEDATQAYRIKADTNRINDQIQKDYFKTAQSSMYSAMRSTQDLADEKAYRERAGKNVGRDKWDLSEALSAGSTAEGQKFAEESGPGMEMLAWAGEKLFGKTAEAQMSKRGKEYEQIAAEHYKMRFSKGRDWVEKTDFKKLVDDAMTNPNSKLAIEYNSSHSLGGGSITDIAKGFVGMGRHDVEQLAAKYISKLDADAKERFETMGRTVMMNPAWRRSDHERQIWVDEVGRHRYERTLQPNPI